MSESTSAAEKWTAPPVGSPCWMEIPAVDVQACKKFYAALFPSWTFKPSTDKYPDERIAMWSFAGPSGLSGGIIQIGPDCKSVEQTNGIGMTVYLFVESIEETQKRVEDLGGTTAGKKEPEGDSGWYMYFKDVAGNRFGVYEMKTSS